MQLVSNPSMKDLSSRIIPALFAQFGGVGMAPDAFAIVLFRRSADGQPVGFSHRADCSFYPCSLVKAFHMVHALKALETGRLLPHPDLDRALNDMIVWSSNTATNYVIDLLTRTTGDTRLELSELADWIDAREGLNRHFRDLGWGEFTACSITQKLMDDRRYGREAQYAGHDDDNLNILTPSAAARLMWELFDGDAGLEDASTQRARSLLQRSKTHDLVDNPQYQLAGYLGGSLPDDTIIHSKSGHTYWTGVAKASWHKHDMIRFQEPGGEPLTVVLMSKGKSAAEDHPGLFPKIGRMIYDAVF